MINLDIFFNNRITHRDGDAINLANLSGFLGDFCLTPVRCLFNGNQVIISSKAATLTVGHEKEYGDWFKPKRNFLRIIVSITLLVPGLILGTIFKGLSYLSESIRDRHHIAIQSYTPLSLTIGSLFARLNLHDIQQALDTEWQNNHLNQPINTITIYAEPNTEINNDPGLLRFNPDKIILVGASIVHQPSGGLFGRLDDQLVQRGDWESKGTRMVNQSSCPTFVMQWKLDSVEEAEKDTLPRKSLFSFERYKRIYVI